MNQKNSLGLNKCFLDLDDPFELFEKWFVEAKKKEINDENNNLEILNNKYQYKLNNFNEIRKKRLTSAAVITQGARVNKKKETKLSYLEPSHQ